MRNGQRDKGHHSAQIAKISIHVADSAENCRRAGRLQSIEGRLAKPVVTGLPHGQTGYIGLALFKRASRVGFPARLGSRVGVCALNIQAEPFAHVQFE